MLIAIQTLIVVAVSTELLLKCLMKELEARLNRGEKNWVVRKRETCDLKVLSCQKIVFLTFFTPSEVTFFLFRQSTFQVHFVDYLARCLKNKIKKNRLKTRIDFLCSLLECILS